MRAYSMYACTDTYNVSCYADGKGGALEKKKNRLLVKDNWDDIYVAGIYRMVNILFTAHHA